MKKAVLCVVISTSLGLTAGSVVAFAPMAGKAVTQQGKDKPNAEDYAKRQSEQLKKELDLSDEQTKKVYDALLTEAKKKEEVRNKASKAQKENKEQREASFNETESKLKEILSQEQYEKYSKSKEERKNQKPEFGNKGKRGQGEHQGKKEQRPQKQKSN